MIYNDFKGIKLSALGMGTMRFPIINGDDKEIDEKLTKEMIDYALQYGVNYFDTAWMYHGGNSEIIIGKYLKNHPRNKFYLATKFPGFDPDNFDKKEEIFEKQLEKCQVEYFDFYLLHNVSERNVDLFMSEEKGLISYLLKQKELGRIKHLGFSSHGEIPTLEKFLSKFGNVMEFCQLQINYIDYTFQNAKEKMELLEQYNIPVWVMEPLRGGKLAVLNEANTKKLNEVRDEKTPAWAFRFLQSFPQIKMILSGMSNFEQLKENIETFSTYKPLDQKEMKLILDIAKSMSNGIPCTSCKYCTEYCPQGLDIPRLIRFINEESFMGYLPWGVNTLSDKQKPNMCLDCKKCESVCPQGIKITEVLKLLDQKMNQKK